MPSAFFAVNLTARKPEKRSPQTNAYTRKFLLSSPWQPKQCAVFAGALRYPRYRWFDRVMIRFIMKMTGERRIPVKKWNIQIGSRWTVFPRNSAASSTKSDRNAALCSVLPKKAALEKFFEFRGCALLRTPYNAPPLTGNNDSSNENQSPSQEEQPGENTASRKRKRLTLQRESVICTSRVTEKYHGNERSLTIYQTICVGTHKTISSYFGSKKISSLEE